MRPFFIKVTDALNGKKMLIRGDLIMKIEEKEQMRRNGNGLQKVRSISFMDGQNEYVEDEMDDLAKKLGMKMDGKKPASDVCLGVE